MAQSFLYAFVLGSNEALSLAEIFSVLKREGFVFVTLSITAKTLVIKTEKKLADPQKFINQLGGTIKIISVFAQEPDGDILKLILDFVSDNFTGSKFVFGVSFYGERTKNIGFEMKKELKKIGVNSRFVQGKKEALSAPEITHNKILEKGADFVIIGNQKESFLGKTIAVQDYESYSHRDYDRPRRNAKSGMLPPKVAQIMLNLISQKNVTIYDPFCGNGTILQEALLLGLKTIGSDISKERVSDTMENLHWLAKEYGVETEVEKIVFQADALLISKKSLPEKPDSVVTETHLGPPLSALPTEGNIKKNFQDLTKLYLGFLKNLAREFPDMREVIMAIPFYKGAKKDYFLEIIDEIKKIGYNTLTPLPEEVFSFGQLKGYNEQRKTLLYSREDQIVGREILVLKN